MANYNNSNSIPSEIVSIGAAGGIFARATMKTIVPRGQKKVITCYSEKVPDETNQTAALNLIGFTISQKLEKGVKGHISMIIPDSVAPRVFQMMKHAKAGLEADSCMLSWMTDKEKHPEYFQENSDGEEFNIWENAINFCFASIQELLKDENKSLRVHFVPRHQLTSWAVYTAKSGSNTTSDGLKEGTVIKFDPASAQGHTAVGATAEGLMVFCDENSMLNGEFKVEAIRHGIAYIGRRIYRDHEGKLFGNGMRTLAAEQRVDKAMQKRLPSFEFDENEEIEEVEEVNQ